jgi:hypothetical protein
MRGKSRFGLMNLTNGSSSKDYSGYDKIIETLSSETAESRTAKLAAFIGSPVRLTEQIKNYNAAVEESNITSLQVNFNDLDVGLAERSMRLFSRNVMPYV